MKPLPRGRASVSGRKCERARLAILSPAPEREISGRSHKRHDKPPDEDAFDDADGNVDRTQAFQFRFQVVMALAAFARIRFDFSPAVWALHCLPPVW